MLPELLSADLTILLGVCTSVIVLTSFIYFISTLGTKEKSFEEALEEQKKRSLQDEFQSKQPKKEKDKKFKKWSSKRAKEKADHSESSKESLKREISVPSDIYSKGPEMAEIQIIEPKEVKPKKKSKVFSKTNSASNSTVSAEEVETTSKVHTPVQEVINSPIAEPVENKIIKSTKVETKEKEKPKVEEKSTKVESKEKPKVEEKGTRGESKEKQKTEEKSTVIEVKEEEKPKVECKENEVTKPSAGSKTSEALAPVQPNPAVQSSVSKKKKKVEQADKDIAHITVSKLLSLINEAALGDEESQMLVDVLLNKQKEASTWTKMKDTSQSKKKHSEVSTDHEQKPAPVSKQVQEFNQEKINLEKTYKEKIAHFQQENQALAGHLKQAQEQLAAEKLSNQQIIKQLEKSTDEKVNAAVRKVEEEKTQLQKTIKKLEAESRSSALVTENQTLKKSLESLQKVHALLVEQHTEIVNSHQTEMRNTNAQILDAKQKLQEAEGKNTVFAQEIETLKTRCKLLEATEGTLESQMKALKTSKAEMDQLQVALDKFKKKCSELEGQVASMANQITELMQQKNKLNEEINNLQEENERLTTQLVSTKERVAGDGQEIVHQNGELNGKSKDENEQVLASKYEKTLQEKESILKQLYDDLLTQKNLVSNLNEQLDVQKQKNNELREKNWKAMEALTTAEKTSELKVAEIEKLYKEKVEKAQKEAQEKMKTIQNEAEEKLKRSQESKSVGNSADASDLSEKLQRAEAKLKEVEQESQNRLLQVQSEVQKNEELSSKLLQLEDMQASSEKRVGEVLDRLENMTSELKESQARTKECLLRIFPVVVTENTSPFDVWLLQFTKQAIDVLQAASKTKDEIVLLQAKLNSVNNENSDLLAKVKHYETVIADTEASLTSLQNSAKSKEEKWKEQMLINEQKLQDAIKEKEVLAAEKEKLESTLQQVEKLDELQDKLRLLQNTLEAAESERTHLEQKCDEISKNYVNLKDQLDGKDKVIQDLQKEIDHIRKDSEDLKTTLEKEKKINKDFSAQMIRLNSLVKIRQDALNAEQETVKKLQSQLQAAKLATTNGTPIPPATDSEGSEDASGKK